MEFEIQDMYEIRYETNNLAYLKNRIIQGIDEGDFQKYEDRLKERFTKVEPLRKELLKAYEELRDVTGTKGTATIRKIILALGGFR